MNNLIIYGCGGAAIEFLSLYSNLKSKKFKNIIFIDDKKKGKFLNHQIYSLKNFEKKFINQNNSFLISIAKPEIRKIIYNKLRDKNFTFAKLIDETSLIRNTAKLLSGVVVLSHCYISENVKISSNVLVNSKTLLGHDVSIGKNSTIYCGVNVLGGVKIEENVEIGSGSNIYPNVKIGKNTKIMMGSCVYKNIPQNSLVAGNPAKVIKKI